MINKDIKDLDKLKKAFEKKYKDDYQKHGISDYHRLGDKTLKVDKRNEMHIGEIYENAAVCHSCNEYVRSKNKHDFRSCSCGNVSVDGGSHYARRSFRTMNFTDIITPYDDVPHDLAN